MAYTEEKIQTSLWHCVCERCDHHWDSVGSQPPVSCGRCKSAFWNRPKNQTLASRLKSTVIPVKVKTATAAEGRFMRREPKTKSKVKPEVEQSS